MTLRNEILTFSSQDEFIPQPFFHSKLSAVDKPEDSWLDDLEILNSDGWDEMVSKLKEDREILQPIIQKARSLINKVDQDNILSQLRERDIPESLIRKARTIVGNTQRLKHVLRKLRSQKECLHVLIIGSSVSQGLHVGGVKWAWQEYFRRWANRNYPCFSSNDRGHQLITAKIHTDSTMEAINSFHSIIEESPYPLDLVLVEFGTNDPYFFQQENHLQTEKMDHPDQRFDSEIETLQWVTEILIRKLLALRRPNPVAVMWIDLSWWHLNSHLNIYVKGNVQYKYHPYAYSGGYGHYMPLSYYDIPAISTTDLVFQMLFTKNDVHLDSKHPFFEYSGDWCCNPAPFWHGLAGMVLAYNFVKEMRLLNEPENVFQEDLTMRDPPEFRTPWRLTENDIARYVNVGWSMVDFTEGVVAENVILSRGWKLISDGKSFPAMIARESHARLAVKLNFNLEFNHVVIRYASFNKNLSPVHVWFDDDSDTLCETCQAWKCDCQEFSNHFGTKPFKWACAKGELLQDFWHSYGCQTKPNQKEHPGCDEGFDIQDLGKTQRFTIINPVQPRKLRAGNSSRTISFRGTGEHTIQFCLRNSAPYQRFKLLSIGHAVMKDT